MIKGLIIDYGGILGYTSKGIYSAIAEQVNYNENQVKEKIKEYVYQSQRNEINEKEFWENIMNVMGEVNIEQIKKNFREKTLEPILIQCIKELCGYKKAQMSNFSSAYQGRCLEIDKLFDVNIRSNEVGSRKPEEKIYLITLEKLGLKPEECLIIDDQKQNLKTAQKLGMNTILYTNSEELIKRLEEYRLIQRK